MKNIIVTVSNEKREYSYDVEIPVDIEGGRLLEDLVQTLNSCNPSLYLKTAHIEAVCDRTGFVIRKSQTAEELGIRNGDYITIRRRG